VTVQHQDRIPFFQTLRARLLLLLVLAVLPVLVVSVLTACSNYLQAKTKSRHDLESLADVVTDEVGRMLGNAFEVLSILRHQPEIQSAAQGSCGQFLAGAIKGFPEFSNIVVTDNAGRVICSSAPNQRNISFAGFDWFKRLKATGEPVVGLPVVEPLSHKQVIFIAQPLSFGPPGANGAIALTIPNTVLLRLRRYAKVPAETSLFILNETGQVILGPTDSKTLGNLPADPSFLTHDAGGEHAFAVTSRSGRAFVYAVVPMLSDKVFGVVARAAMVIDAPRVLALLGQVALPVLFSTVTLVIVWFGTDRILLRWIKQLRAVATAYRRGRMEIRTRHMDKAPLEVRQLAETLDSMAGAIAERENHLVDTIRQREALLAEVHHRVKNNLQIITSLLNLHARSIDKPEEQAIIRDVQARIEALALVHRNVYLADDLEYITLSDFLPQLAQQITRSFLSIEGRVAIEAKSDPIRLTVDETIPVAQLVVEAVTNSCRHAFPDGRSGHVRITARADPPGHAIIEISDDGIGLPDDLDSRPARKRVGHTLIDSFARQLGGTVRTTTDKGTHIWVRFPYERADAEATSPPEPAQSAPIA
jgi:two-component sensor histidine kinase